MTVQVTDLSQGANPTTALHTGQLVVIDALSLFTPAGITISTEDSGKFRRPGQAGNAQSVLEPIWTLITEVLSIPREREVTLIIEDIALWEWSAIAPTPEIERFLRAVRALCRKVNHPSSVTFSNSSQVAPTSHTDAFPRTLQSNAALIILYHTLSAADPPTSDVHRLLLETCTTHIDCRPLTSGRSGAVSGEVRCCLRDRTFEFRNWYSQMITRRGPSSWGTEPPQLLQYRLTDASVVFFPKGTSTGVI